MPERHDAQHASVVLGAKLNGNVARDGRNSEALRSLGWGVMTVWECELADEDRV
jgi:DNA mismatch endonuclease, patch repair protein